MFTNLQESFYEPNKTWSYETVLEYRCPVGKSFHLNHPTEPALMVPSINISCQWDSAWQPSDQGSNSIG